MTIKLKKTKDRKSNFSYITSVQWEGVSLEHAKLKRLDQDELVTQQSARF